MFKDAFTISCFSSFFLYLFICAKEFKILSEYITQKKDIQHIHQGLVHRLGGIVLFSSLLIFYLNNKNEELEHVLGIILISLSPLFALAFIEDINRNVLHVHRLLGIFLSIAVFIFMNDFSWPRLSFIGAEFIYNYPFLVTIFFSLIIATIVNGVNFVDGMNGLAALSALISFLCLYILAYRAHDIIFMHSSLLLIGLISVFILFNFPFAKIFLGDSGAYLIGFVLITMLIIFYGKHPELSNWEAIVTVFYYAYELIFSFFRKIIMKRSPLKPDLLHLHLLLYSAISRRFSFKKANPVTSLALSAIYIQPAIYIYLFKPEKIWMGLALSLMASTYMILYFYKLIRFFKNKIVTNKP